MLNRSCKRTLLPGASLALLVACLPSGLDATFAGTGTVTLNDAEGRIPAVFGMNDGSVISTGRSTQLLTHIQTNGDVDEGWSEHVPASIVSDPTFVPAPSGMLVSGLDATSQPRLTLVRDDGTPDPSFGTTQGTLVIPQVVSGFAVTRTDDGYLGFSGVPVMTLAYVAEMDVWNMAPNGTIRSTSRVRLPIIPPPGGTIRVTVNSAVHTPGGAVALRANVV